MVCLGISILLAVECILKTVTNNTPQINVDALSVCKELDDVTVTTCCSGNFTEPGGVQ